VTTLEEPTLTFLKQGIHDVFRHASSQRWGGEDESFVPLYERNQLRNIFLAYQALINSGPEEEDVQKFMENNPIIWSFLSPEQIIHKPPVLTHQKADFAILTSQKDLYLIELEKPQTRLLTKEGGIHHELQDGFNHFIHWNYVVTKERSAFLGELKLKIRSDDVHAIHYMLIAGLTTQIPPEDLMKLRLNPTKKEFLFFCFDEIGDFLNNLEGQLVEL